jgi:hypothetical protein
MMDSFADAYMGERHVSFGGSGGEPEDGTREWLLLTRDRVKSALHSLRSDRDAVERMFDRMERSGAWVELNHPKLKRPFRSFDEFCASATGFGRTVSEMRSRIGKLALPPQQGGVAALAEPGEIGNGRGRGNNVTSTDRGNSAGYLVAKIKRDAPEFAERLALGEFASARACARAAGIKVSEDKPLTVLRRAWKRATPAERATFLAEAAERAQ